MFVVDTGNHRVQKFDLKGKFLLSFGRLGSGDGDFNKPMDLVPDRGGNLYVADGEQPDPEIRLRREVPPVVGKFARRRGVELNNPVSVAYAEEGFGQSTCSIPPNAGCRSTTSTGTW